MLARERQFEGRLEGERDLWAQTQSRSGGALGLRNGSGKVNSGDEIVGMTWSFFYARTPSVMTTLRKVDDRTSYQLMGEFYRSLKTMNKAEALRRAQLKTMKEFPQPLYWAAYGLTGEP